VGKSTLIQKVLQQLQLPCGTATGFYTEEVRNGSERVGFDVVTLDGHRGVLSRVGPARKVGRCVCCSKGCNELSSFMCIATAADIRRRSPLPLSRRIWQEHERMGGQQVCLLCQQAQ
jgi:nucleoside-triphosphatase